MEGEEESGMVSPEEGGVYMLAAADVFERLRSRPDLVLSVSMFEIYGQKVRDLLNNCRDLQALEDGKGVLQLVGLSSEVIPSGGCRMTMMKGRTDDDIIFCFAFKG